MGQIALEGMRFYAYHGFYDEEQIIGNNYVIDVYIQTNFGGAMMEDDLHQTINYETVYLICQKEMKVKTKLIETIIGRIEQALKYQFKNIHAVRIKLTKENPMPGIKCASSSVEIESAYTTGCGRCGAPLVCYADGNCWCNDRKIHPHTQAMLEQKYSGCLCGNCLDFYSAE